MCTFSLAKRTCEGVKVLIYKLLLFRYISWQEKFILIYIFRSCRYFISIFSCTFVPTDTSVSKIRMLVVHEKIKMKRLLFLILTVLCGFVEMHAIKYNVYVRNADGKPLKGVEVYSFLNRSRAEAAYREALKLDGRFYEMEEAALKKYTFQEKQKTDERGYCIIECIPDGSVVIDADDLRYVDTEYVYDFSLFHVSSCQKSEFDYTLEIVLQGKKTKKAKKSDGKIIHERDFKGTEEYTGGITDMELVEKRATPSMPIGGEGVGRRHGRNKILITKVLDVDGDYARDDARFVAFPFIVFEETKDSVTYMPPSVIDGEDYHRSMNRRMSFDSSRDKLDEFRYDHSLKLQNHNSERFLYSEWARIVKGTKYHIPGILWFEDYNGVYHRDSLLFSDGKEQEPMRFLDWSDARQLAPIDRDEYFRQGRLDAFHDDASFKLNFDQGKSTLNLNDSMTVAQRDSMLQWLGGYDEGQILKIEVRGYSSPEGSEGLNRTLSRSRSATIKALLQSRLPNVRIETVFDDNDNIVPWETVADVMTAEMEDTVARMYAARIREIVADKNGFDAKYRAVRANAELYDYLSKHVLERVRNVDIRANIIVQKVLSKEEIIERYEHDPGFRLKMEDYQYYVMMCHLADNERWDELYDVSKRAYDKCEKMYNVPRQFRVPGLKDSLGQDRLSYVTSTIPYPLAGYYYAVSTLRKGMSDVNILKPYLDDGKVNRMQHMNGFPFIVAQVLMYCQREEFDGANELIKKYNLRSRPELKGLIMFVRCLDGQYMGQENRDVREYVMSTSEMNKAVILAALGEYSEALQILYGDDVPENDAKIEYLKAICHFNMLDGRMRTLDRDGFSSSAVYNEDEEDSTDESKTGKNTSAWAAPMLNALRLDNSNVKYLETDGYFNDAYRQMIMYFWIRLQAGVPMAKVAAEYDALVAQMRKRNSQGK